MSAANSSTQPQVKDTTTCVDGLALGYRRWTPPGQTPTNPPFLLIHGLASASRIWDLVAPELLKLTGAEAVALDQRGHGRSDKPDSGYSNDRIVADDYAVASELKLAKPLVVGHSWGATIALSYAATHIQEVSGVVLVDGGMGNMRGRPGMEDWEIVSKRLAPPEFVGTPREQFLDFYRRGPLGAIWNDELAEIALNIVELREDDTVAPRLSRANHMQILRALWETDNMALARQVSCPVLMISAQSSPTDDWALSKREGAAQMQAALTLSPKIEFVEMADTIHDIPLQRPALLAQMIVRFGRESGIIAA